MYGKSLKAWFVVVFPKGVLRAVGTHFDREISSRSFCFLFLYFLAFRFQLLGFRRHLLTLWVLFPCVFSHEASRHCLLCISLCHLNTHTHTHTHIYTFGRSVSWTLSIPISLFLCFCFCFDGFVFCRHVVPKPALCNKLY